MQPKYRFYCDLFNFSRFINLNVCTSAPYGDDGHDQLMVAQPAVFVTQPADSVVDPSGSLLRLSAADGQALMDELWRCDIRPSEGSGSAGSLAATERHLKDMQRLVFEPIGLKP